MNSTAYLGLSPLESLAFEFERLRGMPIMIMNRPPSSGIIKRPVSVRYSAAFDVLINGHAARQTLGRLWKGPYSRGVKRFFETSLYFTH